MSDNLSKIKKEDKKAFKGFLGIIIIVSGIAGYLFSANSAKLRKVLGENLANLFITILEKITPFASIVLSLIVIVVSKIIYTNCKKGYESWKQTSKDDGTMDKVEQNIDFVISATCVNQILGFFFVGAGFKLLNDIDLRGELDFIKFACWFAGLIVCHSSSILIQKAFVNLQKEINPLLKGSIFDTKFKKKYIDSCDESTKLSIYKNGYKSFLSVNTLCPMLWLFCTLGLLIWDFGLMPMVMVTIIWLVSTVSYCMESIKH